MRWWVKKQKQKTLNIIKQIKWIEQFDEWYYCECDCENKWFLNGEWKLQNLNRDDNLSIRVIKIRERLRPKWDGQLNGYST